MWTDTLPADLRYSTYSVQSGPAPTFSQSGQTLNFRYSTLAVGQSAAVTVTASVVDLAASTRANGLLNTAYVSAPGITPSPASALVDVDYPKLDKRVRNVTQGTAASTNNEGKSGDVLEYCFAINNFGSSTLNSYTLRDTIPANTTYVPGSASISEGQVSYIAPDIVGVIPSLEAGETEELCFRVTIN